jgi:phage shock protein C
MFCTQCGLQIPEDHRFCHRCGARTDVGRDDHPHRVLMLDKRNKKIAGVCAGFARYFEQDVVLIRVIWLVLSFGTGLGFIAYPIAWILMPSDHRWRPEPTPRPATPQTA